MQHLNFHTLVKVKYGISYFTFLDESKIEYDLILAILKKMGSGLET